MKIPSFFTEKHTITVFLLVTFVFAIIFLFLYHPLGGSRTLPLIEGTSFTTYATIVTSIGFVVISFSRMLLYHVQLHTSWRLRGYIVWIVVELVVLSFGLAFIANMLKSDPSVALLDLVPLIFFDIVSILAIPYTLSILVALLRERTAEVHRLRETLNSQENTAVAATPDVFTFYTQSGRFALSVKTENVLYLEAADNYVNIHYLNNGVEDRYLLHNTMKSLSETYQMGGLIRCHRGYMVNIHKVKVARRQKDGLLLDLYDCDTSIPVTKTYAEQIHKQFSPKE